MERIAGHDFIGGACACGRRFSEIAFAAYGDEWVGKSGIAHSGDLSTTEQGEILAEVERIHGAVADGARL